MADNSNGGAGMGWQPGQDGDRSAAPDPLRDPRLSEFAQDGEWDGRRPSAAAATVLEDVSGPQWRCPGASRDEMLGMLRQAQALESWAAAVKAGILRSLIRDDDEPLSVGGYHGDLPEGWTKSLTHEVALALAVPAITADKMMWTAWDLQARLPGIGALLEAGELTYAKAKVVSEAFLLLNNEDAATAEALVLPELPGKTYGQVKRLAEQAAITVDPDAAARRREHAERENSRVTMFREDSGAVAVSGRDLPVDQALSAHAHVCARAQQYKDSGAFPADTGMDQFRAAAYLDLLNGKPAEVRIASGQLEPVARLAEPDGRDGDDAAEDNPGHVPPPRLTDLVLPLATLLGLAERPGESHGLGPLDPDLCRELAIVAIGSPWTRLCVTVTDSEGIAIGHGCAKPAQLGPASPRPGTRAGLDLPAQVNLTITAARLTELTRTGPPGAPCASGPPGQPPWSFTRASDSGPPGGSGTWPLILPDGRQFTVALEPMPTYECDHRHESHAYQPNDRLRHLVQIRDYACTFPPCNRHARESDFEHALPYDKGGRTCGCNAGARSRACHQIKQSPGWRVTQPRPGWHEWQTPSGRSYIRPPKRYPT